MEWFWYIIAALGAGIGTGLAGLSAATVMVPILKILHCIGIFLAYIIPLVLLILPIRFLTKIRSFIFRKLLHMIAFTCVSMMILAAESWQAAALTSILAAILIIPILVIIEPEPWYQRLFVEKSRGEIKRSTLMLFLMFAAVIAVSWGIFDEPHLAALIGAFVGTGVELVTPSEYDTVTVPVAVLAVLLLLTRLL